MTQTPKRLLRLLDERDGHVDAWSGVDTGRLVPQHRVNRQMGGSRERQSIANLVWIDSLTNGKIPADADLQREAYLRGIQVQSWLDPATVPVCFGDYGWALLDRDGGRTCMSIPDAMDTMRRLYGPIFDDFMKEGGRSALVQNR